MTVAEKKAKIADKLIKVLNFAVRGCSVQKWTGFENGNGEEFGSKLDNIIALYHGIKLSSDSLDSLPQAEITKPVAEKKAALLDSFIRQIKEAGNDMKYIGLLADYDSIKEPLTFTEDPYIDEIFNKRVLNLIQHWKNVKDLNSSNTYEFKRMRTSDLPAPDTFKHRKGWGKIAMKEYTEIFNKYRT